MADSNKAVQHRFFLYYKNTWKNQQGQDYSFLLLSSLFSGSFPVGEFFCGSLSVSEFWFGVGFEYFFVKRSITA